MNESMACGASRRARLMQCFPEALVLVRGSGPEGLNPNFFYLTGLNEPAAVLVLSAPGVRAGTGRDAPGPRYLTGHPVHQVLFLPASNPLAASWGEDARATLESTPAESVAVDAVLPLAELDVRLTGWLQETGRLAFARAALPSLAGSDPEAEFVDRIRSRFLGIAIDDATRVVAQMRTRKDALEIGAIQRAVEVTARGFDRLCAALRPGTTEHALEAELTAAYRRSGADHAFGPIVGAGRNALKLHYRDNAATVEDGALVLVDSGARLAGYRADVTRTLPASGIFSARQRELYEVVLAAQQATIAAVKPGAFLGDLHVIAWESIEAAGYGAAFIHGIGHHLGIETHDAGDRYRALEEGAVITVEPGVYLADEGIGIRIEDDVLVTAGGQRVLSALIPKTVEAIERWMRNA